MLLSHDNHCSRSQGNIWQQILSFHFILELVTTVPFLFTVSHSSRSPNLISHPLSADLLSIPEAPLHSRVSQLLACQALAREHVCKSLKVAATADDSCVTRKYFSPQNDLHRAMQKSQSALSQQLTILSATLLCLVFTR